MAVVYAVYHAKDRPEHFNNLALQLSASMLQLLRDLNDKSTDFIQVDVIFYRHEPKGMVSLPRQNV